MFVYLHEAVKAQICRLAHLCEGWGAPDSTLLAQRAQALINRGQHLLGFMLLHHPIALQGLNKQDLLPQQCHGRPVALNGLQATNACLNNSCMHILPRQHKRTQVRHFMGRHSRSVRQVDRLCSYWCNTKTIQMDRIQTSCCNTALVALIDKWS